MFAFRNIRFCVLALACASVGCDGDRAAASDGAVAESPAAAPTPVRVGAQVLLRDSLHLVSGRRVGLVTNHTGIWSEEPGGDVSNTIDALWSAPDVELVALFGPEHGIRGEAEAGAHADSSTDERTGNPIHSVYGATLRPTAEMLEGVEVLVFDMQDVGARYYTYVSTMAYAMEEAGRHGIPFVVLDRPNPIRGDVVQGNVLDPAFSSFVGLYPVPMRHGMTVGELARMFVGEFGLDVELHVVPMEGWTRDMTFDRTGQPWVAPSPNLPTLESALHYPGTCLFEGTPLSVGRGTERAFQWVGAPWLDGDALADAMNGYAFEGGRFEAATFTPGAPGDRKLGVPGVHGRRLHAGSTGYDAPRVAAAMLVEARRLAGDRWAWRERHIDLLAGGDALRSAVDSGLDVNAITADWAESVEAFRARRARYLLY